jgi:HSP20 family protein
MATLIRWSPFRETETFTRGVNRAYEAKRRETAPLTHALPLDLYETEKAFVVTANVPGLKPEQIQVNFEDGVLTIVAEVAEAELGENTRTLVRERAHGRFARSIRLADSVDTNAVEAVYNNGVLTLTLPKTPESQPKQIQVKFTSPLLDSQN